MPKPLPTACLNGRFLPLSEARVSPLDRGFLFGDGVYEVIPVYVGEPFRLDQHLSRLAYSLDAVRMANPLPDARWRELLTELIAHNGGGTMSLYLQVTRGMDGRRDHRLPDGSVQPTVFAMAQDFPPISDVYLERGVDVVTAEDIRWHRCDIKSISLLANVLHKADADDRGAEETLVLRDGYATEGASSTLFVVDGHGTIRTPPKTSRLLPGVTRDFVIELAHSSDMRVVECNIAADELLSFAEIWITSSLREVVPVTTLNGEAVGNGAPGPVWTRIHSLFQEYRRNPATA